MDLNKDLKYIKKKYGEKMMHYCRECFPTILNVPGKLVEILNTHFYCVRDSLYIDIVNNHKEEEFNDYIYSRAGLKNEYDIRDVSKTPKELLDDAVNDYLYLSYPLTKEKILNIGPLTSECGNDILSEDDDDFVKLEHEGKITYLKRIYG